MKNNKDTAHSHQDATAYHVDPTLMEELAAGDVVDAITGFLNDPENTRKYSATEVLSAIARIIDYYKKYKKLPPDIES